MNCYTISGRNRFCYNRKNYWSVVWPGILTHCQQHWHIMLHCTIYSLLDVCALTGHNIINIAHNAIVYFQTTENKEAVAYK